MKRTKLPKNENSRAYRKKKAATYDNLLLEYVTEHVGGEEVVLGKGGSVSVRRGEVIVLCAGEIVFRAIAKDLSCSDLLSGNGAIFSGWDLISQSERNIVVHFSYYRK